MKSPTAPAEDERNSNLPTTQELTAPEEQKILQEISGQQIEEMLISLAAIDGVELSKSVELQKKYAVNTLALSDQDMRAREHLKNLFLQAGMTVAEHPLGLIATYEGLNPELPAIGMMSHFDSVPTAGMYDGTVGILSAIHIVQTLQKHKLQTKRSIKIIALTGEESARFNIALFGSKGIFQGLNQKELDMHDSHGITIAQALEEQGFDPNQVRTPHFSKSDFSAIVEFHVAQDDRFPNQLSVIEAIAAPERYKLEIGRTPVEQLKHQPTDRFLTLTINGKTGHSGATPMGSKYRTDGLVIAADVVTQIIEFNSQQNNTATQIAIGNFQVDGQAMNKIPGKVTIPLCITGKNPAETERQLIELLTQNQTKLAKQHKGKPILEFAQTEKGSDIFFDPQIMHQRQLKTIQAIKDINKIANLCARSKCVGTVSTYTTANGIVTLGIDLRGINLPSRNRMVAKIKEVILASADLKFSEPLPGSGTPEVMDKGLVSLAQQIAQKLRIPFVKTFSPAGHDIQNIARAGIRSIMIQCPSRNGGIAHTPDEYSTQLDLEWGAQTMAALVLELAQK